MRRPRTWSGVGLISGWAIVVVLAVASVVQYRRAEQTQQSLKARVVQAETRLRAIENMRSLLGDEGIAILKNADQIELLRISGPAKGDVSSFSPNAYTLTSTGKRLGKDATGRFSGVLLNPQTYSYLNADDLPEPQLGLRCECDLGRFDILVSSEAGHVDLWFHRPAPRGSLEWRGPVCIPGDELTGLVGDARNIILAD